MATARAKASGKGRGTSPRTKAPNGVAAAKEPTTATPWGAAIVVEEASVPQRAGERRFSVVVQLLETRGGERLVRLAYATSGSARRGPVTMRARDLERLRAALERAPALLHALESAMATSRARADP